MNKTTITLKCSVNYNLQTTCNAHGWNQLAPFFWDDGTGVLSLAVLIGDTSLDVSVRQSGMSAKATITSLRPLDTDVRNRLRKMLRRCLGLDVDTSRLLAKAKTVGPDYAGLVRAGAGRLLRSPTLWEDAVKTLFTTNCSWSLTKRMCTAVCSDIFSPATPSGVHPFPPPRRLSAYASDHLKTLIPVGYRADYLTELAERFLHDPELSGLETREYDYSAADEIVRRSKGFADYACAHLLVLAGYYHRIPVDTTVVAFLKKNHRVRKPASFITRHYRTWGADMWWGYRLERMLVRENQSGG
jgi:hypothetical protein